MQAPYTSILLFGPPGVGKGTQGAMLSSIPGFYHLGTGDIFRSLNRDSVLGQAFLKYSTKGLLVPDELTIEVWHNHVAKMIKSNAYDPKRDVLLLDGIPRSKPQALAMDQYLDLLGVVHLVCKDIDEMVRRLRHRAEVQNRPDDADDKVIRRRFDVYKDETSPVLAHYHKDLIFNIDAIGSPAAVLLKILEFVVPATEARLGNPLSQ
jgi:adenylate kinase